MISSARHSPTVFKLRKALLRACTHAHTHTCNDRAGGESVGGRHRQTQMGLSGGRGAYANTHEVDGLVDAAQRGHVHGLATHHTGRADTGGVFARAGLQPSTIKPKHSTAHNSALALASLCLHVHPPKPSPSPCTPQLKAAQPHTFSTALAKIWSGLPAQRNTQTGRQREGEGREHKCKSNEAHELQAEVEVVVRCSAVQRWQWRWLRGGRCSGARQTVR
jgi:hypothetical protein